MAIDNETLAEKVRAMLLAESEDITALLLTDEEIAACARECEARAKENTLAEIRAWLDKEFAAKYAAVAAEAKIALAIKVDEVMATQRASVMAAAEQQVSQAAQQADTSSRKPTPDLGRLVMTVTPNQMTVQEAESRMSRFLNQWQSQYILDWISKADLSDGETVELVEVTAAEIGLQDDYTLEEAARAGMEKGFLLVPHSGVIAFLTTHPDRGAESTCIAMSVMDKNGEPVMFGHNRLGNFSELYSVGYRGYKADKKLIFARRPAVSLK